MSAELKGIKIVSLAAAAAVAANGNGAAVDLLTYDGQIFLQLNAGATVGADNTLDVKIQHSADGSTNWTDSGVAFSQVNHSAGSVQTIVASAEQFHRFIRVVDTVAGTTPSCPRAVSMVAKARV